MMHDYYVQYPENYSPTAGFAEFFINILFWVLIIYLIVNIVKWLKQTSLHEHDRRNYKNYDDSFERTGNYIKDNTPVDILKERYAKGEINKIQFEDMRRDLL